MKKQYKVGIYCRLSVDDASNSAKAKNYKISGTINSDTFAILIQKSEQERIQKATRLEALLAEERKARQEVENIRQWAGIIRR